MLPSELGCYSSHYSLWLQLVSDPTADKYIVLEDDTIVNWLFMERLVQASEAELGADLLRLYFTKMPPVRELRRNFLAFGSYSIIELLDSGWGAVGYVLNKRAAERLVGALQKVLRPVDIAMEAAWLHGLPNLAVFPFPVMEEGVPSSIPDERYSVSSKPLGLKARRGVARLLESIRKWCWRYRRILRP